MTRLAMVAAVLAMLAAACSGRVSSDDAGGRCRWRGTGVAAVAVLVAVAARDDGARSQQADLVRDGGEKNTLCDWFAPMVGGTGRRRRAPWR
jgi:hypothetical protein